MRATSLAHLTLDAKLNSIRKYTYQDAKQDILKIKYSGRIFLFLATYTHIHKASGPTAKKAKKK